MDAHETGQRIARARRRRGMSQAVLAGLVGRSESWLSQVERGKRAVDSHTVLTRLAEVLHIEVAGLTGQPGSEPHARRCAMAAQIEHAMISYEAVEDLIARPHASRPWDMRNLLGRADAAYSVYQAARYEEAGRLLLGLIRDVERASRAAGSGNPALCTTRARVYDTAAALLNRVDEHALAWAAADRAMAAAEQSGQPLLAALGAYRLAYVLADRKHPREAVNVAMAAAAALERTMASPSAEQLSVYGGLHLAAANAAAIGYDRTLAPVLLAKARRIAQRFGADANIMGTAFGPVNVAIHTMSAAVRLGDSRTAAAIGEALNTHAMPRGLTGRRAQVQLDLARAYAMRRKDAAAVNALIAAEKLSPQLVRFDERTRDLITGLLHREHRASTPELRPLARRAGVV